MSDWLLSAERYLISATVLVTGALFLPALADPVNVVKLTVLVLAALALVVLSVTRLLRSRVLGLPRSFAVYAALAFGFALVVSTAVAPNTSRAVVGTYGRNSGLMAYAAALVMFFVGLRAWTAASGHVLALGVIASGAFTAIYGLLQYAGIDAIHWNNPFNPIIASLGNPDFASAYLGMCTPAAAWGVLWRGWAAPWRALSGLVGVMCLAGAVLSKAVQGPLAAAAGLAVLAAALLLERGGTTARRGLLALGAGAGLAITVLVAGGAKLGPAAPIFRRISFQARQFYWDGALEMFRRHPLTGVGLEHYGAYWRQVRSDSATQLLGGTSYSDSAHSVPLQMLAQGGLLLGLTYLGFVVSTAFVLVRGLRRLQGSPRLLLGAIGGVWVAYVVSAAVSIDQVPLLTVEFVTAGAVVGLTGVSWREARLPGAFAVAAPEARRRGRTAALPRERDLAGADIVVLSGLVLVGLVAAWFSLIPFRANSAVHRGDVALAGGDGTAALAAYQHATDVDPGEGAYWEKAGSLYETARLPAKALAAYSAGVAHDRYDIALLLDQARLAQGQGQPAVAAVAYKWALSLDPTGPATVEAAAAFAAGHGQARAAAAALARAASANPRDADLEVALGAASRIAGDLVSARAAYQRALAISPGIAGAAEGLRSLG